MRLDSSLPLIDARVRHKLIWVDHVVHLVRGMEMRRRCVSMSQPRNITISARPLLAFSLRMEVGSGRDIGSVEPASGWKMREKAMRTA